MLEEARRSGKHQVAPFRKKFESRKLKTWSQVGRSMRQARQRSYSDGSTITGRCGAPLSAACECCQCTEIEPGEPIVQYQVEIPQDPIYRPFTIETGIARNAEITVRGRHELQTFEAAESASVQLGPRTYAVFAWQNKRLGISRGKIRQAFGELFGISISRSTPAHS